MVRYFLSALTICLSFAITTTGVISVVAQSTSTNFTNSIKVESQTTTQGQNIVYNITESFTKPSRGIFFAIPNNQDGVFYNYTVQSVVSKNYSGDENNNVNFEQAWSHDEFRVRIGDKNTYLPTGTYEYTIKMVAKTADPKSSLIKHNFTYLYDWQENIVNIELKVDNKQICNVSEGQITENCDISKGYIGLQLNQKSTENGFFLWKIKHIETILILGLTLIASSIIFFYLYNKYARDPKSRLPRDRPEFEPPDKLYPWQAQFLISGIDSRSTLLSYILWLNHKGFITIEQNENENNTSGFLSIFVKEPDKFSIGIKNELPANILPDYFNKTVNTIAEKGLTWGLSESKITTQSSRLSEYFYSQMKALYFHTKNNGLLATIITHCVSLVIFLILLSTIHYWVFIGDWTKIVLLIAFAIPIPFEIVLLTLWPKVTQAGAELRAYCQRYKYYLTYVEKFKLDFSNNPDDGVQFYLKSVPMAAAFGILDKFNTYFADLLPADTSGSFSTVSSFTPVYQSTFDNVFSSSSSGSSFGGSASGGSSGGGGSW